MLAADDQDFAEFYGLVPNTGKLLCPTNDVTTASWTLKPQYHPLVLSFVR